MKKLLFLGLCSVTSSVFAQTFFKSTGYEVGLILSALFYINLLFIFIITYLAQKGKKILTFLTLILENVFILLIGVNFGLQQLSILLFIANPFILFLLAIFMIRNKGKLL